MPIKSLLIANRGEVAIRVARAAAEAAITSHSIYSEDDAGAAHTKKSDLTHGLTGAGPAAYLDGAQIIQIARSAGCDAIHPGYGFLSENPDFARDCEAAGLIFVGPSTDALTTFGDKAAARRLAAQCDVPVLPGTDSATTLAQAHDFFRSFGEDGAVMIKAIAGGGGRGMRPVHAEADLDDAYERCRSEAKQAFGSGDVYLEQLFPRARHIEVQVAGDGSGKVVHLWERECSLQRARQKLIEVAPAPGLSPDLRKRLLDAALRMAAAVKLRSLATFEFLVEEHATDKSRFAFIEANARLQVEHTVTEEITGIDLVRTQLDIAGGQTLKQLGLEGSAIALPRGIAMQLRVNAETMSADGIVRPASPGTLQAFDLPAGPGVRVDTCGHSGFHTNPRFDSLLAKLIVHVTPQSLPTLTAKARRALSEFRIEGISTNREFLLNVLSLPDFADGAWYTGLIEDNLKLLCAPGEHPKLYAGAAPAAGGTSPDLDSGDPLAVLAHGQRTQHDGAAIDGTNAIGPRRTSGPQRLSREPLSVLTSPLVRRLAAVSKSLWWNR